MNQFWPSQPGMFPGWRPSRGPRRRVGGIAGLIIAIVAAVAAVIVLITVIRAGSDTSVSPSGPCVGGPAQGATGEPIGHGNYRFPCSDGGSTVVHLGG